MARVERLRFGVVGLRRGYRMNGCTSLRICAAVFFGLVLLPVTVLSQPAQPPDPAKVTISTVENRAVVLALADVLRERFAFRERGAAAARKITAMESRGTFRNARSAEDLMELIDSHIAPVVNDRHFRVRYMGPEMIASFNEGPPSAAEVTLYHEEIRLRGGEIPEARWLAGNVGYLRINMFLDAAPSVEKLTSAMGMLADSSALIIDVRGSPGGEPAGVATAIGHLVGERTATVRAEDPFDPSSSRTYFAEPKTPGFTGKPVFVLIDGRTASGAEEFAYDLQAMRRATLVGETTKGAATPGGFRPLAHGFAAFIPMQVVTNTVTGANWEGVGVTPDVKVAAAQSLARAHRLALEAILKDAQGVRRAIAEEGLASLKQ